MRKYFQIAVTGLLLAVASQSAHAGVCAEARDLDACLSGSDPVASCQQALDRSSSVSARLSLCEAYVGKSDLEKAREVLQRGLETCSGRRCSSLKLADSNVRELKQREDRKIAEVNAGTGSRDRAYCTGPIANTRSIDACKRLLKDNKGDVAITEALADKLLNTDQPTQALQVLQGVASSSRTSAGRATAQKATAARSQQVQDCYKGNSLAACDAVLLSGDSSESQIQRTRGILLSTSGRPKEALEALQASAQLKPADTKTADAIVALQAIDYGSATASYFQSLASAHRTLGNEADELAALQKLGALPRNELNQSMRTALARLAALQPAESVPEIISQPVVARVEKPTPKPVVKAIEKPRAQLVEQKVVEQKIVERKPVEPEPAVIASLPIARIAQPQAQPQAQPEPRPIPAPTLAAVVYANSMDSAGRSH